MSGSSRRPHASEHKEGAQSNALSNTSNITNINSNMATNRPYNQRINLSLEDEDEDGAFFPDATGPDLDDEELTRDRVKRASSLIMQAVDRRKRRVGGKKSPSKDV